MLFYKTNNNYYIDDVFFPRLFADYYFVSKITETHPQMILLSPKVEYKFADFFAMVTSLLFEVNYN